MHFDKWGGKLLPLVLIGQMFSCQAQKKSDMKHEHTNALADETSPYLLQHQHNPVNWQPWGEAAFVEAAEQNKLVVISIGYSACHWCHVMERESFEDTAVAELMNEHFVSVKVDREERPDVDQIYMTAVQLMTGSGGWPLNVVALPDGRPLWGGTYFPKENWMQALKSISEVYKNDPEKVLEYAEKLTEGVRQSELVQINENEPDFTENDAETIFQNWSQRFDTEEGGPDRAPKFPLPNNYEFLLQFGHLTENEEALEQVKLTLRKMAFGGIYDQVGGGFARYSTDAIWKAPHFEKMLYDNAQLLSLYAKAYQKFKDPLYAEIIEETYDFLEREMSGENGEFYSALDADSEGEEGKFYVWSEAELREQIPENEWDEFSEYYDLKNGKWEGEHIILLRKDSEKASEIPKEKVKNWNRILLEKRAERERPGLDDKALTSWNGLMITGLVDASNAFGNMKPSPVPHVRDTPSKEGDKLAPPDRKSETSSPRGGSETDNSQSSNSSGGGAALSPSRGGADEGGGGGSKENPYLKRAKKIADWILKNQLKKDNSLYHSYKDGKSTIEGLLEDYTFSIQAFIKLFEATGEENYLRQAEKWTDFLKENFEDENSKLFYTRNLKSKQLIAKSLETTDNVIPASNSAMAKNLFLLSHYLDKPEYLAQAEKMLNQINKERLLQYGDNFSNWGQLLMWLTHPFYEVAISGKSSQKKYAEFQENYYPNALFILSKNESDLPLLENRFVPKTTMIYVCQNKVCQLPVEEVWQARELIK